jgi:hypothetical protein
VSRLRSEHVEELEEMKDLRIDIETVGSWFEDDDSAEAAGVFVVRVPETAVAGWRSDLTEAVRRCYASDEAVLVRTASGVPAQAEFLRAVLPDPGSVMSGDFGEVLTFLFLGTQTVDEPVVGPKKWRLKQDRRKAAPHSDVVQFVVPQWPASSEDDRLICAEVKSKATTNSSTPIEAAGSWST